MNDSVICGTKTDAVAELNRKYIEKLQEKLEKFEAEVTMDFAKIPAGVNNPVLGILLRTRNFHNLF